MNFFFNFFSNIFLGGITGTIDEVRKNICDLILEVFVLSANTSKKSKKYLF